MTMCHDILNETHDNARELIRGELNWRGYLCSNNHNLQFLLYFEAFRQTAYAMISDGGPDIAIELMEKVIDEMRQAKKTYRSKAFDEDRFREAQDQKRDFLEWGLFEEIPYAGEVPDEGNEDYVAF